MAKKNKKKNNASSLQERRERNNNAPSLQERREVLQDLDEKMDELKKTTAEMSDNMTPFSRDSRRIREA